MTEPASSPAAAGLGSAAGDRYRALWQQAAGMHAQLLGAVTLLGGAQLLRLTIPWLAGKAINALQQGQVVQAGPWVAGLLLVYLSAWLLHGPGRVLERNVGVHVREQLSDQLYARIAAAPLVWRDAHHSGELQHRVHQASRALSDFAQNQFIYVQNVFNFAGPLVALWLLSHTSGALALVGYVVIAVIILRFDKALMRLARDENDADRRYVSTLLDLAGNAATVVGLRLQAASRALLGRRMREVSVPVRRAAMVVEGKWFAVDILGMGLTWLLVVVYVWQARQPGQAILLGTVFMIYQYAQQAAAVIGAMAANFQSFARMHTDYGSAAPLWAAPGDPQAAVPAIDARAQWGQLEVRGLVWQYADSTRGGGLRDIDLVLRRGSRVALIGPSGGGKSTLLRALAGLYEPGQGTLLLDGQQQPWARLRELATLIPQEAQIFEATVEENLRFDRPCGDAALRQAIHTGAFDGVLGTLPQGLQSPLAERGANLSGGQRQRLALARGVLAAQGSSLLLLDEPTSALDPQTEQQVVERMAQAFPDACLVASVHRLALLDHFDTVLVLEAGRVVDAGPRDAVMGRRAPA